MWSLIWEEIVKFGEGPFLVLGGFNPLLNGKLVEL